MHYLSQEELELLPTEEEVVQYERHGFYRSKKLFSDEEIDLAVEAQDRFYQGDVSIPTNSGLKEYHPQVSGHPGNSLGKNDYASFFSGDLAALTRKPIVAAVALRLAGTTSIRLWHDQLLYKPPSLSGNQISVGWHTDRQYWRVCSSDNMITAWIPFHDCDDSMGTISFIDGSHKWPDQSADLDFFLRKTDNETLQDKFVTDGSNIVKVPLNLKKGEVSFHHCKIIHGSGPNLGTIPRRSIAVHMQDNDNRYVKFELPDGTLASHSLVRLTSQNRSAGEAVPNFRDLNICPELYREI